MKIKVEGRTATLDSEGAKGYGKPCLICGDTVPMDTLMLNEPVVCDKCKAAVMSLRKALDKQAEIKANGKAADILHTQYINLYCKYGVKPTRVILGVEAAKEVFKQMPFAIDNVSGKATCYGIPVTVDGVNPKLIHVSIGEDCTAEDSDE